MYKKVYSWGRTEGQECSLRYPASVEEILKHIENGKKVLPFGKGKSYGDSCLNKDGQLISLEKISKMLNFDQEKGEIECEAGIILKRIQDLIMPSGWILPVVPGTQFITLGGAISNDVHGKNHLVMGSFGNSIKELSLLRSNGTIKVCSNEKNNELFRATIGGVGLTGFILSAKIKLKAIKSNLLEINYKKFYSYENFEELCNQDPNSEYVVSWLNCREGRNFRGLMKIANHSASNEDIKIKPSLRLPVPSIRFINRTSKKIFSYIYYQKQKQLVNLKQIDNYTNFMYPLDRVNNWNKLYGNKGFYQFQCHLPSESSRETFEVILSEINQSGEEPFLAVLKPFGEIRSLGMLSFPKPGVTFSVDFGNNGFITRKLFQKLTDITIDAGGRLYLAKDNMMDLKSFEKSYSSIEDFSKYRDPAISSSLSRRLMGY
jgi:hypothetical protein